MGQLLWKVEDVPVNSAKSAAADESSKAASDKEIEGFLYVVLSVEVDATAALSTEIDGIVG